MLIFVYGTLKSGCKNSSVLTSLPSTFINPAETILPYPMFDLGDGFPYLQDNPGEGKSISGEVWDVPEHEMCHLDRFEGVPTLYKKGTIDVYLNSETENVACYFKAKEVPLHNIEMMDNWIEEDNPFSFDDYYERIMGSNRDD